MFSLRCLQRNSGMCVVLHHPTMLYSYKIFTLPYTLWSYQTCFTHERCCCDFIISPKKATVSREPRLHQWPKPQNLTDLAASLRLESSWDKSRQGTIAALFIGQHKWVTLLRHCLCVQRRRWTRLSYSMCACKKERRDGIKWEWAKKHCS